jgi:hypothetical protein
MSGTRKLSSLQAEMIPIAITSQRMIPPKILTKIALTFLSYKPNQNKTVRERKKERNN